MINMSSPQTPVHSRHTSDLSFNSPLAYESYSHHRRNSSQPTSPNGPRFNRADSMGILSSGGAPPNGLGNLADELADAWDDEEGEEYEGDEPELNFHVEGGSSQPEGNHDSGVDLMEKPVPGPTNLVPPTPSGRGHRRQHSDYDGSDYGDDSDLDSPGIPPGLQAKMDLVESLARRGTENNGSEQDMVVKRLVESLNHLGGQSGVEGNATR